MIKAKHTAPPAAKGIASSVMRNLAGRFQIGRPRRRAIRHEKNTDRAIGQKNTKRKGDAVRYQALGRSDAP